MPSLHHALATALVIRMTLSLLTITAPNAPTAHVLPPPQCTGRQDLGDLGTFDVIEQFESLPPLRRCLRGPAVTTTIFRSFLRGHAVQNGATLRQLVFRGGVEPDARREVWQYLLGYQW